jgi:hypothetical protein
MATYAGTGEGGVEREGTEIGEKEASTEGECEDGEEGGGDEGGYSRVNNHADEHIVLFWAAIAQSIF